MVDLPRVPSLDLDGHPDEAIPIVEPEVVPKPTVRRATGPAMAPPPTEPSKATGGVVAESVDEVLQQSTEQAIKLAHLQDLVSGVAAQQEDLREELHAGVSELRELIERTATARSAASAGGPSLDSAAGERLDQLEAHGQSLKGRQLLLVSLMVIQLALLGWLGWRVAAGLRSDVASGGSGSASYLAAPPQADGVASIPGSQAPEGTAVIAPVETDSDKAAKKKRRRRRP